MLKRIKHALADERGAVTVDWVVLTAAVVGLAIASFGAIQSGSRSVGDRAGDYLADTPVEDLMAVN